MGLQTFIEKARAKENRKIKTAQIEVEDFGVVEFIRPKDETILDFMDTAMKMLEEDELKGDIKEFVKESSRFVYLCCPDLQKKEVREELGGDDPFQTAASLFGFTTVMTLAAELFTKFGGVGTHEETSEAVKN
jgi:hypothetical protein